MTEYCEYNTVNGVRKVYLSSNLTGDDVLILALIRQVSREISRLSGRDFFPSISTMVYDTPANGVDLHLDADLIELLSVVNGDGSSIPTTDIIQYPLNSAYKTKLRLLPSKGIWLPSNGYASSAISITGVWGNLYNKSVGWSSLSTLAAAINSSATTFSATVGTYLAGMLLRIDDEFLYVVSVTAPVSPATTDTVTVERAVNGSTAASHLISAPVYSWCSGYEIQMLTAAAVVGYYNLKSNPVANSIVIDGITFDTPKDVSKYISSKLNDLSLLRLGFA